MAFKSYILISLVLLGTLFSQYGVLAFHMKSEAKTENLCCGKEPVKEMKDCCGKQNAENSADCDGTCNNPSCHCGIVNHVFALPISLTLERESYPNLELKCNNHYKQTYSSAGYLSIWTPPNIG